MIENEIVVYVGPTQLFNIWIIRIWRKDFGHVNLVPVDNEVIAMDIAGRISGLLECPLVEERMEI